MERNSSDKYSSTTLPGKNQPKTENKYMPLPAQTQQKYENTPLNVKTNKWIVILQTTIGLRLFQVRLNQG